MTEQQLRFLLYRGEDVTRRKLGFICALWAVCKFKLPLAR